MKDKKYIIGIILIAIGYIIGLLNAYLLVIGVIILFIAAIFIFLSDKKLITKILTVVIPIFTYLIGFNILAYVKTSDYKKITKTYLIPSTCNGYFRIVYDETCGIEAIHKNGNIDLNIPENGILILKPENSDKTITEHVYILITETGKKNTMELCFTEKELGKTKNGILDLGFGSYTSEKLKGDINNDEVLSYETFNISYTINSSNTLMKKNLDSIMLKEVLECRRNKNSNAKQ